MNEMNYEMIHHTSYVRHILNFIHRNTSITKILPKRQNWCVLYTLQFCFQLSFVFLILIFSSNLLRWSWCTDFQFFFFTKLLNFMNKFLTLSQRRQIENVA